MFHIWFYKISLMTNIQNNCQPKKIIAKYTGITFNFIHVY